MNRYSKYWQQQFDMLAATLAEIDARTAAPAAARKRAARRTSRRK
jgi:hypothetical protein